MKPPIKTEQVFDYLKLCAKNMRTLSYKEVADEVGLAALGMGQPLGYIRDHICRPRGLPWLNAIVVNADTWRPGDSFLPNSVQFGSDDEPLWRGMVLQVFSYPWDSVPFQS